MTPQISTRLAVLILTASTVVSSYIMLFVGCVLPKFFATAFNTNSASDLDILIPPITRLAVRYSWAFALLAATICLTAVILCHRPRARLLHLVAGALSAQGLVVWFAMFCSCYDGLTGPVSMHHSPELEFAPFVHFAFGAFPVTLCAMAAPGLFALLSPHDRNASAENP